MPQQSENVGTLTDKQLTIQVENVGGIESARVDLSPGVNILTGRNATNRTSLLRAINGVLGGTTPTLKSDAETGQVTLATDDSEFTRTYRQTSTGLSAEGTAYCETTELVDSFATLLETNPARRAVERGENLRDVIMRPVDTAAIERRIKEIQRQKDNVENKLQHVRDQRDRLPELEQRRHSLQENIDSVEAEIESLRQEIDDLEADVDTAEEADELVDELEARRQELRTTEEKIELTQSELEALHRDVEEAQEEREELSEIEGNDRDELANELDTLRDQKREIDNTISSLRTIVEFNDDLLTEHGGDLPSVQPEDRNISAALSPEEEQEVMCWTCGSRVERGTISERLDDLRAVIDEKQAERDKLVERIDTLQEKISAIDEQRARRSDLQRKIERTEEKIADCEKQLSEQQNQAEQLREQVRALETEVAETESLRETDLPEIYERLNELQYERGQHQQKLEEINSRLEEIETLPDPDQLQNQLDELNTELERERTRIEDLESEAVEQFNKHMTDILEILGFDNLSRVWIEQKHENGGHGSSTTVFDLHVVRETSDGTVYEDEIANLSESEREVVGLVVALAGYLTHETHTAVPVVLMDSLEAIDADRIAELVNYFANFASYLVVALLPEDAEALPPEYERIPAERLNP